MVFVGGVLEHHLAKPNPYSRERESTTVPTDAHPSFSSPGATLLSSLSPKGDIPSSPKHSLSRPRAPSPPSRPRPPSPPPVHNRRSPRHHASRRAKRRTRWFLPSYLTSPGRAGWERDVPGRNRVANAPGPSVLLQCSVSVCVCGWGGGLSLETQLHVRTEPKPTDMPVVVVVVWVARGKKRGHDRPASFSFRMHRGGGVVARESASGSKGGSRDGVKF